MIGAGIDIALAARTDHVARAELVRAEKRAAAVHALFHAGLGGIERARWPLRIAGDGGARGQLRVVVLAIPVGDPFPDVAGDVVEAVAVGRKLRGGTDALERILAGVSIRKMALMGI